MSAGAAVRDPTLTPVTSLDGLAPRFRDAVEAGLAECREVGLDPIVSESTRTQALQTEYYRRGRPPTAAYPAPVTYAADVMRAWHFYGLAVDVISEEHHWFAVTPAMLAGLDPAAATEVRRARARQATRWFVSMAACMKLHGLAWGGDWKRADPPHIQWGRCRPSPSDVSILAYTAAHAAAVHAGADVHGAVQAGRAAVWRLVLAA